MNEKLSILGGWLLAVVVSLTALAGVVELSVGGAPSYAEVAE